MLSPQHMAEAYARNASIIKLQAAGLGHADSVLQPPYRGNCLNWVLGHILESRNTVLGLLGGEAALDPTVASRYARDSEPIVADGPGIAPLEELLRALDQSQEQISGKLAALSAEDYERETPFISRAMPLSEIIFFMYFHECYHTGQTEPLRQLAGKNDKVI